MIRSFFIVGVSAVFFIYSYASQNAFRSLRNVSKLPQRSLAPVVRDVAPAACIQAPEEQSLMLVQKTQSQQKFPRFRKGALVAGGALAVGGLAYFEQKDKKDILTEPSLFIEAVLSGDRTLAEKLLRQKIEQNISLTQEEIWIKRALERDYSFFDKRFIALDPELKKKIFYIANIYGYEALVEKLKKLGMGADLFYLDGPDIFAFNTDIVTARKMLEDFLIDLRKDNLLLTQQEFKRLDKTRYIYKGNPGIGRILGRNFVEKKAKELNLKHIKVPKKILVIEKDISTITLKIDRRGDTSSYDIDTYAERVVPVSRFISLEEALELIAILVETGFQDLMGDNIMTTQDGIYIIDNEFTNFDPFLPRFDDIEDHVLELLQSPHDQEVCRAEIQRRKEIFKKQSFKRAQKQKELKNLLQNPYEFPYYGLRIEIPLKVLLSFRSRKK